MKTILLLLIFYFQFLLWNLALAQPTIQWQNTVGGVSHDELFSIQQTADGGYILGGFSQSNISGDKTENCIGGTGFPDNWIIKTDAVGNIQWQNTIGGSGDDKLFSVQQTADGGYILGGPSKSNISGDKTENCIGNNDYWIVKTNALGNTQWQNTIGGSGDDWLSSVQQTADGGYILGGASQSNVSGDKTENCIGSYDYWIVKTDTSGNIQWQNTIGGSGFDQLQSVQQTADGGYILGGYSQSNISGDKTENCIGNYDYWIVKTDLSGNVEWQNTVGGSSVDQLQSIQQTIDGGYILGGYSFSSTSGDKTENSLGDYDYWIVKTNAAGNIQWQNTIGGNLAENLYYVHQTSDGGYILGGYSKSSISGDKTENNIGLSTTTDYWIVKTDTAGNIHWQNTIGGSADDLLYSIRQTADGGYILGGYSRSSISGDKTENNNGPSATSDYWIVKLYSDTIASIADIEPATANLQVYPNPATSKLVVSSLEFGEIKTIEIYSSLGEKVYSELPKTGNRQHVTISVVNFPSGIYFITVTDAVGNKVTKKVVKT